MANLTRLREHLPNQAVEEASDRKRESTIVERLEKVLPLAFAAKSLQPSPQKKPGGTAEASSPEWSEIVTVIRKAAEAARASDARAVETEARTYKLIEHAYEELQAAKLRVSAAEAQVGESETRRKAAEMRAEEAERKLRDTEVRLRDAERRIEACEARASESETWLKKIHVAIVEEFPVNP